MAQVISTARASWSAGAALFLATVAFAAASPSVLHDDILPQPLPQALDALVHQTGLQVIYVSAVVQGQQSRRAPAGLSALEALARLLEGTGLTYTSLTAGSVRITSSLPSAQPPERVGRGADPTAATGSGEEVLVTARLRSEPAWAVPLSLSVVSGEQLAHEGISSLDALSLAIPGMSYTFARGLGGTPVLRGLSPQHDGSTENNVATVYDGLYVSNAFMVDMNMLDLKQIEVVRGPQNALVGRNAFAGAILYEPESPTQQFDSRAEAEGGSGGFARATAFVSGPLSTLLAGRLAAASETFDGTIRNRADSADMLGGWRREAVSGTLQWNVDGPLSVRLSGFWYQLQRDATPRFPIGGPMPPSFNCGRGVDGSFVNFCGAFPAPDTVDISPDAQGPGSQTRLGRLELDWRVGSTEVRSLTGYLNSSSDSNPDDWDMSSGGQLAPVVKISNPDVIVRFQQANIYFSGSPIDDREWSEDLRISGSTDRSQWLAGAYGAWNRMTNHEGVSTDARGLAPDEMFVDGYYGTLTPTTLIPAYSSSQRVDFSSLYGSLGWSPDEAFDLAVQLRWNREQVDYLGGSSPLERSYTTPRFTVGYRLGLATQIYASAAKGVRSALYSGLTEGDSGIDTNWTYEFGFKHGGTGDVVEGSATLFLVDWNDMQLAGANSARVTGLELAADAAPSNWLSLHALYAYTDARYRAGTLAPVLANRCTPDVCRLVPLGSPTTLVPDVGGNRLPNAPLQAASLRAQLHGPLGLQRWSLEVGVDLVGSEYAFADDLNWLAARQVWNIRCALAGERWEAALWARNLGVRRYSNFANYEGIDHVIVVDRANAGYWGATLAYRFR